ncbi:MAG: MFS transporter, partial [Mycolicibacterium vanbaalenii]
LGGYFTDHLTWRWAFWINVPIGIVVLIVALTTIPALRRGGRPVIDYAGIVLIGLGASGLTLATSWGGSTYPWSSPVIIGLFAGSGVALALFVRVELRAEEPVLPIRLFASPVFTVCCILSFIVGFAMLGALTFLPTFMQFVDGVSATESGLRTLPMVGGLLLTSMGSGVLVSRTGRYKIFPVAGTAVMVVGFVLLSQMDATTPMLQQSAYLFILGTGIGMCMQVLILIVQSTATFSDLGVATSGVTFFRTIGSSFGAAIFGSLFANFLDARIVTALAGGGAPPEAAQSPQVLHRLPDAVAAPIVEAYSDSLGLVFLYAAPVALLGFLVALTLKQVPLQEFEASAALDMGEGFGMPSTDTPEKMLETAVGRLVRQSPEIRLRSIAGTRGCESDVALLWALIQIYRQSQVFGSARLTEMAERLRVPPEVLEPTFDRLVECGHALRTGDQLWLTQSGAQQVDAASSALVGRIVAKLEASPAFEGRPDRGEVEAALERIALRLLVQRDWDDDRAELPTGGN